MDWTNPETIDTAFYTMKGLEDLAKSVPADARPKLLDALAGHFSLPKPPDLEDQSVKRVFVFSRMKLDTLPDQEESRALFTRVVSEALGAPVIQVAPPSLDDLPLLAGSNLTQQHVSSPKAEREIPEVATFPKQAVRPIPSNQTRMPLAQEPKSDHAPASRGAVSSMQQAVQSSAAPAKSTANAPAISTAIYKPPTDAVPSYISGQAPASRPDGITSGYTSMLLAHPQVKSLRDMSNWLSGKPWTSRSVAIAFPQSSANVEKVVEEEAEMSQGMSLYLKRIGCMEIAPPSDLYQEWNPAGHADWLLEQGSGPIRDDALNYFAWAIGDAVAIFSDEKAKALHDHGAVMSFGSEVAQMITNAADIEQEYLANYDATKEAELPQQIILGSISPRGQIVPGLTLRRAAFMHVAAGMEIGDCLVEALADFRMAQVQRDLAEQYDQEMADSVYQCFNEVFFSDCKSDAGEYRVAKNVIRLTF